MAGMYYTRLLKCKCSDYVYSTVIYIDTCIVCTVCVENFQYVHCGYDICVLSITGCFQHVNFSTYGNCVLLYICVW